MNLYLMRSPREVLRRATRRLETLLARWCAGGNMLHDDTPQAEAARLGVRAELTRSGPEQTGDVRLLSTWEAQP